MCYLLSRKSGLPSQYCLDLDAGIGRLAALRLIEVESLLNGFSSTGLGS